jgi:hypothetical protein
MKRRAAGGAPGVHAHEGLARTPHMLDGPAIDVVDASELRRGHREHDGVYLVWMQICILECRHGR